MTKRQAKKNRKKTGNKKVVLTQQERDIQYKVNRLKYRVQREVQTANKRIKRLSENKFLRSSNAYRFLERHQFDNNKFLVIKNYKGQNIIQFKYDIRKSNWNDLQSIDKILTGFLESKTSSSRGVRKAHTQGYEKFKESTGSNITESEYAEQFSSGLFQQYSLLYSSGQASDFFTTARKQGLKIDEIKQIIDSEMSINLRTPHREMLEKLIPKNEV